MVENFAGGMTLPENVTLTNIATSLLNLENAGKEFRKAVSHADTIKPLALSDTERRKQFGGRVRVMRELLGFTQAELAAKVGISQQSIATYETGRREPPFKNLIALARVFNTSIDWLVTGSEYWQCAIPQK